jgi:hypothetical protein
MLRLQVEGMGIILLLSHGLSGSNPAILLDMNVVGRLKYLDMVIGVFDAGDR